jgi:hypothetical protein
MPAFTERRPQLGIPYANKESERPLLTRKVADDAHVTLAGTEL